jgi:hypothetical protein
MLWRNRTILLPKPSRGARSEAKMRLLYWSSRATADAKTIRGQNLSSQPQERKHCPVFVMGCHRSGTNLLYDTLLSAGGFAVYRGFLPVYDVLIPRFGSLSSLKNRKKMIKVWLRSKGFRRSELDPAELTARILADCRSGGDFIRIHMDEIARRQNVGRWAMYDPDTVLHMEEVKREIPDALFIHIIRDGRDIALSLNKMGGFRPVPWSRTNRSLGETALYWQWMVRRGREYGRKISSDYTEVKYEDLIREPRKVLDDLGRFLDHDLDYDRIQSAGLGTLRESNSSFREADKQERHSIQRWREKLSREQVWELETLVGECLEEFSYALTGSQTGRRKSVRDSILRSFYPPLLDLKLWLKSHTPIGRLSDLSVLELQAPAKPTVT